LPKEQRVQDEIKETTPVLELVRMLGEIEITIRRLAKLYTGRRVSRDKKAEFERMIREAETRAMAILTLLRNRTW
jgi:hypothetical protein